MTDRSQTPASGIVHVFRVALSKAEASRLTTEHESLSNALGGIAIDAGRVEVIDPTDLAGVGLSGYLIDGLGAQTEAVARDAPRLDAVTDPVLILRPDAAGTDDPRLAAAEPLSHLGSYPTEAGRPAEGSLTSASAEGLITGAPPPPPDPRSQRRTSGMVALAALAVMFLVVAVMLFVAG